MYCSKCGRQIPEGAKFCAKCGSAVRRQEPDTKAPSPSGNTMTGMETQSKSQSEKKKHGIEKLLLALAIIFLLCVIGCGVYYFVQRTEADAQETSGLADEGGKREDESKKVDATEATEVIAETASEPEAYTGEREDVSIEIRQVDNSSFPEVTFYANITDGGGEIVENLDRTDFCVQEIDAMGNVLDVDIQEVYEFTGNNRDKISVNLVLDASGSMDSDSKMYQAQNAAISLIQQMNLAGGDQVEIISFDDYVYLEQDFSTDVTALTNAVNGITTGSSTALYDGLYAGLYQTYYEDGVKCVIGFTDGMENASSYTFEDVVTMAQNTGIPVFIIGIGEEYDAATLQNLAQQCSGSYYSASVNDLESILSDIYLSIYQQQNDYYAFRYTSTNTENLSLFRSISLTTSDASEYLGASTKEYVPESDVTGAFSSAYMNQDYMLDFSSQREVTEADLAGLSLAQLRIARNEIFARHGRQFKDSMLNQWFYAKVWYLNLPEKYAPDYFDTAQPSPLSNLEQENAEFIRAYEQNLMDTQDIYPNAGTELLSDYDLALSKAVLKEALVQVSNYPYTDILSQNIQRIQEAIDKEDVVY